MWNSDRNDCKFNNSVTNRKLEKLRHSRWLLLMQKTQMNRDNSSIQVVSKLSFMASMRLLRHTGHVFGALHRLTLTMSVAIKSSISSNKRVRKFDSR